MSDDIYDRSAWISHLMSPGQQRRYCTMCAADVCMWDVLCPGLSYNAILRTFLCDSGDSSHERWGRPYHTCI